MKTNNFRCEQRIYNTDGTLRFENKKFEFKAKMQKNILKEKNESMQDMVIELSLIILCV